MKHAHGLTLALIAGMSLATVIGRPSICSGLA